MEVSKKSAAVVVSAVTIAAATATSLFLGGDHTAPPTPIRTPTFDTVLVKNYVAQVFRWDASPDATGYRLYLDGVVISLYNQTAATLAVVCGVKHRFNAQPYNNKGFAPLAPPVYVTPPCAGATR